MFTATIITKKFICNKISLFYSRGSGIRYEGSEVTVAPDLGRSSCTEYNRTKSVPHGTSTAQERPDAICHRHVRNGAAISVLSSAKRSSGSAYDGRSPLLTEPVPGRTDSCGAFHNCGKYEIRSKKSERTAQQNRNDPKSCRRTS